MSIGSRRGRATRQRQSVSSRSGAPTASYYQKTKPPSTPKTSSISRLSKTIETAIKWFLTRAGALALLVAIIYWGLLCQPTPKLLVAQGTQYRPTSDYAAVMDNHVSKLRDNTKFTFDTTAITSALTSSFPEIDSATVELPIIGRQPVVRLVVAAPALRLSDNQGATYVVASNGRAISTNTNINNLPIVIDLSGIAVTAGSQVFSPQQVSFTKVIAAQCSHASLSIDHFVLPASPNELDMYLKGSKYLAKFSLSGDPVEQVGSFLATRHYYKHHHIAPAQYVDVRVTGKVFYK